VNHPVNLSRSPGSALFRSLVILTFIAMPLAVPRGEANGASGEQVYRSHCATCHDGGANQAPPRDALQKMSAERILRTMDFGLMMGVAYPLKREEREAVAKFLGTGASESIAPERAFCPAGLHPLSGNSAASWNGWSPSPFNTRYQTEDQSGLTAAQVPHLKLKWAFGFSGDVTTFGAPTVMKGTLLVGSAGGVVQAIDAKTGCIHWAFQASGPVRSAILAVRNGRRYSLLFGDQTGWFYSLDGQTGKPLWKRKVDEHEATRLTGSPVAEGKIVFVPAASWEESRSVDPLYTCCTFRGSVTALRVGDGSVVWKTYMTDTPKQTGVNSAGTAQWGPSGGAIWSAPTVDIKRKQLYVTTGDNYSLPTTATSDAVVALDIKTGRIIWSQQTIAGDAYTSACRNRGVNCPATRGPDYDFGSSVLLLQAQNGRDILVAGQKSGVVSAFDPDQRGKILWQTRVGKGGINGGVQWGMASDGHAIYAAVSDLPGVMNLAGPVGSANLDSTQGGGLVALRIEDGSQIWFAASHPCDPPRAARRSRRPSPQFQGWSSPGRWTVTCEHMRQTTARFYGISTPLKNTRQ